MKLSPTQQRLMDALRSGECLNSLLSGYKYKRKPVQWKTFRVLARTGELYLVRRKTPKGFWDDVVVHKDHVDEYRTPGTLRIEPITTTKTGRNC